MSTFLKRLAPFALALSLVTLLPARTSHAWGPSGHKIVAILARHHLSQGATAEVERLLKGDALEDVANWADAEREERPETAGWHFVNLPRRVGSPARTPTGFLRSRDCKDNNGEPGCVVTAIEKYKAILADTGRSDADRLEALKFIVHFVGDMHQPLHCSFADDRGGNNIKVTWFGRQSNLHRVWDSGIIGQANLSDEDFAAELEAILEDLSGDEEFATAGRRERLRAKIEALQSGTLDQWATDSFKLAVSNGYDAVPRTGKARLGAAYYATNVDIVDEQLTKGGLRLAKILNDALR
ncbi:MAG TPA: S1/P1 nuclease [Pyrinomonadaceae bacterium]|nr:S1/P1 nuclease [Pyrinomonadaceae bacterium]